MSMIRSTDFPAGTVLGTREALAELETLADGPIVWAESPHRVLRVPVGQRIAAAFGWHPVDAARVLLDHYRTYGRLIP